MMSGEWWVWLTMLLLYLHILFWIHDTIYIVRGFKVVYIQLLPAIGMGMGMIRWEWEGNGNKKVIPAHLYITHVVLTEIQCQPVDAGSTSSLIPSCSRHCTTWHRRIYQMNYQLWLTAIADYGHPIRSHKTYQYGNSERKPSSQSINRSESDGYHWLSGLWWKGFVKVTYWTGSQYQRQSFRQKRPVLVWLRKFGSICPGYYTVASPALGHCGTCPLDFQRFHF